MVTDVRPLQPSKAHQPMLVTLSGMVIDVRPPQPEKAYAPIVVTLLGMVVFRQPTIRVLDDVSIIALQPLRESYTLFPSSTLIAVRLVQP